ncbi:DNA-binding transcriptional LysR family regulator [Pseudomonas fragi]
MNSKGRLISLANLASLLLNKHTYGYSLFCYFLEVAQQRSFTRATGQLGIASPTLNRQIQDMEQALVTRLFVRQQPEISLTEAAVQGQCRLILAGLDPSAF